MRTPPRREGPENPETMLGLVMAVLVAGRMAAERALSDSGESEEEEKDVD